MFKLFGEQGQVLIGVEGRAIVSRGRRDSAASVTRILVCTNLVEEKADADAAHKESIKVLGSVALKARQHPLVAHRFESLFGGRKRGWAAGVGAKRISATGRLSACAPEYPNIPPSHPSFLPQSQGATYGGDRHDGWSVAAKNIVEKVGEAVAVFLFAVRAHQRGVFDHVAERGKVPCCHGKGKSMGEPASEKVTGVRSERKKLESWVSHQL